ncbi:MAG: thioredoxin domain-containing protein [Bacillota bacterium]
MEKETNQLIHEKSPYLLQHAHNPVNWYPWGDKAFNKAKQENLPVFLSIGYSTCHWCHVMEKESFEDQEVAKILNQNFVAIKVDREERPDVDNIYMEVCQVLTGRGGWPLTIIMTPEKEPFFAGTYFPKESKRGMPGLIDILTSVVEKWESDRASLIQQGQQLVQQLIRQERNPSEEVSPAAAEELLEQGFESLKYSFDNQHGGFGAAPKFPRPHNLLFLLRYSKAKEDEQSLEMVKKTLDSMCRGGIYDQIGYGFSRYSTDKKWLVPHFEKMLYDNALLAITYLEAYQKTEEEDYRVVAQQILEYLLRDMQDSEGGFYSAEDADSEGEEGKFYLWSQEEIKEVLGAEKGQEFCDYYDITAEGNFEGSNIPNLIAITESVQKIDQKFSSAKRKLFAYREQRVRPAKDDKILTGWNGLMIAALALAARVLDQEQYQEEAKRAVQFIEDKLIREDGRLLARYRDGEADYLAYLQDYAFLIWGLIELYQSSFKEQYLELAVSLNQDLIDLFWDQDVGGLYLYGSDGEKLITRPKKVYDGALPAGNSIAALNFWRLAQLTENSALLSKLEEQLKFFYYQIKEKPAAHTAALLSFFYLQDSGQEIVINNRNDGKTEQFLAVINSRYLPFSTLALKQANDKQQKSSTVQICQNFSCQTPLSEEKELRKSLS